MTHQHFDTPTLHRRPVIGLMGEFSAGKTTLLNVLVGREMLPTRVTATRVPPIWLSYGPEQAHYVDTEGQHHAISLTELETVPLDGVVFIKIMTEAPILQEFDLFDTPGISDPNISDEVRLAIVQHLDGVIWCTHATQAWRESERSAWLAMPDSLHALSLLLVTRSDALSERDLERVLRRMTREAGSHFGNVLPMSSLLAAEAMHVGDTAKLDASGVTALKAELSDIANQVSERIARADDADTPTAAPILPRRVKKRETGDSEDVDFAATDMAELPLAQTDTDGSFDAVEPIAEDDAAPRPDPDMANLLANMARIGQPASAPQRLSMNPDLAPTRLEKATAPLALEDPVPYSSLMQEDQTHGAPDDADADVFLRLSRKLDEQPASSPGKNIDETPHSTNQEKDTEQDTSEEGEDVFLSLISGVMDKGGEDASPGTENAEHEPESVEAATVQGQSAYDMAPLDLGQFDRIDAEAGEDEKAEQSDTSEIVDATRSQSLTKPEADRAEETDQQLASEDADTTDADPIKLEVDRAAEDVAAMTEQLDAKLSLRLTQRVPLSDGRSADAPHAQTALATPFQRIMSRQLDAAPIGEPPKPKLEPMASHEDVTKLQKSAPDKLGPETAMPAQVSASQNEASSSVEASAGLNARRKKGMAGIWRQVIRTRRIETITDMVLAMEDFLEELDEAQFAELSKDGERA